MFYSIAAAQLISLAGSWNGAISGMGQKLPISIQFSRGDARPSGTISLQGAQRPLQNIFRPTPDSVSFAFTAGSCKAVFDGHFTSYSTIAGCYSQNSYTMRFELNRQSDAVVENKEAEKPYRQQYLNIPNQAISIGGTLTQPKTALLKRYLL